VFLEHFGLDRDPFGVTADARYLYFSREHKEALSALYLSVLEGRGLCALIANAGMGKTTLLRYLAARLAGRTSVAFLSHPYRSPRDLMRDVLERLGLPGDDSEFHQMRRLEQHLAGLRRSGSKMVLLFDEGQALSAEALEQIRLLSNFRSSNMNLLEIVLAGQQELEALLEGPEMEALRQRISVVARVEPFDEEEVDRYLRRRLAVSGREQELFDEDAVASVTAIAGGIPRNINHLCYKALALAWADGEDRVSAHSVEEAGRDLGWLLASSRSGDGSGLRAEPGRSGTLQAPVDDRPLRTEVQ